MAQLNERKHKGRNKGSKQNATTSDEAQHPGQAAGAKRKLAKNSFVSESKSKKKKASKKSDEADGSPLLDASSSDDFKGDNGRSSIIDGDTESGAHINPVSTTSGVEVVYVEQYSGEMKLSESKNLSTTTNGVNKGSDNLGTVQADFTMSDFACTIAADLSKEGGDEIPPAVAPAATPELTNDKSMDCLSVGDIDSSVPSYAHGLGAITNLTDEDLDEGVPEVNHVTIADMLDEASNERDHAAAVEEPLDIYAPGSVYDLGLGVDLLGYENNHFTLQGYTDIYELKPVEYAVATDLTMPGDTSSVVINFQGYDYDEFTPQNYTDFDELELLDDAFAVNLIMRRDTGDIAIDLQSYDICDFVHADKIDFDELDSVETSLTAYSAMPGDRYCAGTPCPRWCFNGTDNDMQLRHCLDGAGDCIHETEDTPIAMTL